jgi:hypothetical protein
MIITWTDREKKGEHAIPAYVWNEFGESEEIAPTKGDPEGTYFTMDFQYIQ